MTDHEETAKRLLPCKCEWKPGSVINHLEDCPAFYRPAVADALKGITGPWVTQSMYDHLSAELDQVKAERDKLQKIQDEQDEILRGAGPITCVNGVVHPINNHGDCLYCERAAEYARGLQRAIEIMRLSPTMTVSKYWLVAAIQAEIAKG